MSSKITLDLVTRFFRHELISILDGNASLRKLLKRHCICSRSHVPFTFLQFCWLNCCLLFALKRFFFPQRIIWSILGAICLPFNDFSPRYANYFLLDFIDPFTDIASPKSILHKGCF